MGKRVPVLVDGQSFISGVFLIDKPVGATSFAMVKRVRWLLGIKKVGHAGTLDPFATGLLIICAGRPATRHIDLFMKGQKTYRAVLQLGVETDTLDPEGEVVSIARVPEFDDEVLQHHLLPFIGPQLQTPPAFSAAKHKGKPLYYYARKGIRVEKEAKPIEIYSIGFIGYDARDGRLEIEVTCSRGTYIRVLASDIGKKLGCGAHLIALRRTASGTFRVEDSLSGDSLWAEDGQELLLNKRLNIEEVAASLG